jgi:tRNA-dihydrouridine synthase
MFEVTDMVFRQVIADLAPPDMFFTEFVNVDGLQSVGRPALMKYIQTGATDRPLIAHIWGSKPENFRKTAQELVASGLYAGIDLNMGCPAKDIVKRGCCSGLIEHRDHAVEIIRATKEGAAGKLPVSVKARLGLRSVDFSWHELLLQQGLGMLTIHGRTTKQMSGPPADWDAIGKVRELRDRVAPETLIIGNGDIDSHEQGLQLANKYGLDGVMVGRGVFHNPLVFAEHRDWSTVTRSERITLFEKHIRLFAETWQHRERAVVTLNKFCKVYINGFDGAKEMREQLMQARDTGELLHLLEALR